MKCNKCGYDWSNSGDSAHVCGPVKVKQQEQGEPVAYIHRNEYNEYRLEPHDNFDIKSIPFNVDVSLFKSSQQRTWVGLTHEECFDIIHTWNRLHKNDWDAAAQMILMVEAKLRSKNT